MASLIVNQPDTYPQICPEPIVQVLQIKPVSPASPGGCDRYRLVISDGAYFAQSMLASEGKFSRTFNPITKTVPNGSLRIIGLDRQSLANHVQLLSRSSLKASSRLVLSFV